MNKKNVILAIVVLIGLWSTVITVHAVEINGDFESGTKPGYSTSLRLFSNNISDWIITSGSIDYVGTEWRAASGDRSIDLNGITAGTINQVFTTKIGSLYEVAFNLSGNPKNRPDWDGLWSPPKKN